MIGKHWEVGSTWFAENLKKDVYYRSRLSYLEEDRNVTLLSTCRSAITIVLNQLGKGKRAIVPSFTCHSVVSPFINAGYEVKGYPIKENLEIDMNGLLTLVDNFQPDVILIHGYFGFNTVGIVSEYLSRCKANGIIIIEDRTQNMFSTFKRPDTNNVVGSIRKWLPVPDGAFLTNIRISGLSEDTMLAEAKVGAMKAKSKYIVNGEEIKNFMTKFTEAERILDSRTTPFAISNFSLTALNNIVLSDLADCRRDNYNTLVSRMLSHQDISVIFPKLIEDVVPFLLPVYIAEGRSDFQSYMAQHNVYPTIIWKCPEVLQDNINSTVQRIYDRILCFHIDQRYNKDDMNKVADIIDSYFNNK